MLSNLKGTTRLNPVFCSSFKPRPVTVFSVMGRRKTRPHRSVGIVERQDTDQGVLDEQNAHKDDVNVVDTPFFVEVDRSHWIQNEHRDISEMVLTHLNLSEGFSSYRLGDEFYQDSKYCLRFRLQNVDQFVGRIKLGHWPVLPATSIFLEFIEKGASEEHSVILSGSFDGPDEGVTGLVHLVSLKFFELRPVLGVTLSEDDSSLRVRVEILETAFDACESLLENTRPTWKRSMMNVMAWLRPEVMTSEARYGISNSTEMEVSLDIEMGNTTSINRKHSMFDAAGFYEAIKPSKEDPVLEDDIPDLLPELRPYQRRAAYWMVQRERGISGSLSERDRRHFSSPLCVCLDFVDTCSGMFYNPFSGNVSLHPEYSSQYIFGGILADEMGLGKTVELLACIFSHRMSASEGGISIHDALQVTEEQKVGLKRLKRERVECICGSVTESLKYKGLWVQCDICDAWQHSDCVGYSPKGRTSNFREVSNGEGDRKKRKVKFQRHRREKNRTTIIELDGEYICQLCSELIQATDSPVATGATLIVCPAPILSQWQAEIIRHTNPGSLKTCLYEGVRISSLSNTSVMGISDLVSADIVLTTYDVLREDLSHDSDRHEGDCRFMRFQKRYPVIPTLLTRISWWRICLDEAQMVESNAASATEMALRLHAKHRWCITGTPIQRKIDDLYGLLRFLKASPFDSLRWWIEVIRDPYEKRDVRAMEFTHSFFKQIMWRSSKLHVADELQLPPQEECLSWLSFSPIEEHFYQRQHETCVSYAREVIESFKHDILKRKVQGCVSSDTPSDPFITHVEAAKLLNSLLKLRQACCHPQVGSSGLRSLQQSPMTMEEILQVLIGKTKIEGEEALRCLVVALNGLAGIAIVEQDLSQAVSLYQEALDTAEKHSEDFRLDPLLNIHIHHNLAEILPVTSDYLQKLPTKGGEVPGNFKEKASNIFDVEKCDKHVMKRQKVSREDCSGLSIDDREVPGFIGDVECHADPPVSLIPSCLRTACENIKQKYLSVFSSKLSVAQEDFRKSYMQVCNELSNKKNHCSVWWLEVLHHIEENKDSSSELIRKIVDAVSEALKSPASSRIASRFRSITGLRYHIQTGLDSLEAYRQTVVDRLLEIDQTMEKPRDEDVERLRYCPKCIGHGDGPLCVHCELDELFQVYEARLFRSKKDRDGGMISAEEAVDLQKKNSALNRFYWGLSQPNETSTSSTPRNEENTKKRDIGQRVVVSKSPSELEVVLGVIKSYSKARLGKEGLSAATKQLHFLEDMRKEYAHARSLARAQLEFLLAHDEIKMATSRLHLRENESDKAKYALSSEELVATNVELSHEKLMALTSLSHIKGQLRYLKGLVQSKQKLQLECPDNLSLIQDTTTLVTSHAEERTGHVVKADEESCPVCQEKLSNRRMVFQCGHVTCCKCLFAMTEQRLVHHGKIQDKWIMCPTCRRHTDFANIAYAYDEQNKLCNSALLDTVQDHEKSEASLTVQGSYGTKVEAVTRRILWIKSMDPKAKVLVFSSWNDVLDVLEHALTANHVSCIRMKGGRKSQVAISRFREQKDSTPESKCIQVLLLLIQHGANGLNLLEAQHVVMVEPLLNPAVEAQAISRVHRIGQENRTLVHRFIVKDTVEESIYKLNRKRNTNSFISGNTKNQDQPVLTVKDVESLFAVVPSTVPESKEKLDESLMHLPPSVAAAIAAERRLNEGAAISQI